jgi:hypothetical protein
VSEVLIYILFILGAVVGLILLAPIHFDFGGEYTESLTFQGRMRWAGGMLSFAIIRREGIFHWALGIFGLKKPSPMSASKTRKSKKPPKREKPRTNKEGGNSFGNISSFLNLQLFTAVKDVFHQLVRALHLELNLSGTYGFDDPSLTGVTVGLIAALERGSSSIDLNPDFTRAVIDLRGSLQGWIFPVQILAIGIVFSLMKSVRAIWWPRIKFRKKQKEAVQYV